MQNIYSHTGFNSAVYYLGLLSLEKGNEVPRAIGDTIINVVTISNFKFDSKGLASYGIQAEKGILEGFSDTLQIRRTRNKIAIKL